MTRNIIISEIEIDGNSRNYEEKDSTLEVSLDPKYVVLIDRMPDYDGEFGFDKMQDNYLTGTCVEGLEELKKEYSPFDMAAKDSKGNAFGKYYIPWLCMFPDHKSIIGKDVRLVVKAPIDYFSPDVSEDVEEFTIEPENGSLRVEPNKISLLKAMNGALITIFCDSPLASDTVINFKSSEGVIVGKMNVAKNSDYKNYSINIPVVFARLTDMGDSYNTAAIETEIQKTGNLQQLEEYLNKQSLNQALIQVKFEYKNGKPYDWAFSRRSLNLANQGYNTATGTDDYEYHKFKDMIVDPVAMKFDSGKILNFFHHQFKKKEPSLIEQKNIILYLTSLDADTAGGSSFIVPLNNKHCIIFKSNLDQLSSFAHEIGHTLGLMHTFADDLSKNQETFMAKQESTKQLIQNNLAQNANADPNHPYIRYLKSFSKEQQEIIDGFKVIFRRDKIKFDKKKTENIMDYDLSNRKSFFKFQCKIMQDEVKNYYH
jgi:hypothetical protein